MLKVVLDTNIFVSSIFWDKGNPHKTVELALDKTIKVYTSIDILKELEKVLRRDFKEPDELIHSQISLVMEYAELIKVDCRLDVVQDDPDDNKIVECAISAEADFIVTGDPHLLNLKEYKNIKIVSPREFLNFVSSV